jgi:hypothetical protein
LKTMPWRRLLGPLGMDRGEVSWEATAALLL